MCIPFEAADLRDLRRDVVPSGVLAQVHLAAHLAMDEVGEC